MDINPMMGADILTWAFVSAYPSGYFDIIKATPPCTDFSLAKTTKERAMEEALRVVESTLHIID